MTECVGRSKWISGRFFVQSLFRPWSSYVNAVSICLRKCRTTAHSFLCDRCTHSAHTNRELSRMSQ